MDVFSLRDRLVEEYSDYIRSFIQISDQEIREKVQQELESGALWPEPLIQLNPAFEPGELDAAFFHLYGVERDDVDYILETFPIVKRKDVQEHGDYRTKLVILDIYDRLQEAIDSGEPYRTRLDPPPADPSVAHPASER